MSQTLLALGALVLFALFSFSQGQGEDALARRAIGEDVERALEEAARGRMAEIAAMAFDEADVEGREGIRTTPSGLPLGPDDGETTVAAFDDVDDFHGLNQVLGGPERRAVLAGQGVVDFDLTVQVRFVDPLNANAPSATPTLAKEVAVFAMEVTTGATGRPPVQATFRRVFTPVATRRP